jgi:tRNA dimethylallyltransferase
VALTSGRTLTEWIGRAPFGAERYEVVKVGLVMPSDLLTLRIDARVEEFFAAGLVEEVRALLESGVPREANALKALGYREVMRHLEGEMDLPAAAALVKANTRRYARRQLTWFRREPAVIWFQLGAVPEERFPEIVSEVALRLDAPRE